MSETCIVIGVGSGVGEAVARRFARGGFDVALVARTADRLAALADEIKTSGVRACAFPTDAAHEDSLRSTLRKIMDNFGAPDALIYNAAAVSLGTPSALIPEMVVRDFRTTVLGALIAAQEVLPTMRTAGKGSILLTGGGFAMDPQPSFASLGIGKAGLRNLTLSLAKEAEPAGIHVATVTIAGLVKVGTPFEPARIADEFWKLHGQRRGEFQREIILGPVT